MIECEIIGGPYDGRRIAVEHSYPPVRFVIPTESFVNFSQELSPIGLSPKYIEMLPTPTRYGWRLFWPKGAS